MQTFPTERNHLHCEKEFEWLVCEHSNVFWPDLNYFQYACASLKRSQLRQQNCLPQFRSAVFIGVTTADEDDEGHKPKPCAITSEIFFMLTLLWFLQTHSPTHTHTAKSKGECCWPGMGCAVGTFQFHNKI